MRIYIRFNLIFLMVFVLAFAGLGATSAPAAQDIAKNEVRIFMQPDFNGPYQAWNLDSGLRQRLIQSVGSNWEGKIISLQMGTDVGVMLFQNKYFRFMGSAYINFSSSVANIKLSVPGAENKFASLILYPKNEGNPVGLLAGNSATSDFRFFPLPENINENIHTLADIRHLVSPVDYLLFFPGKSINSGVVATLYSDIRWQGQSLKLPLKAGETRYDLGDLNFASKSKSLKIEQVIKTAQMQQAQGSVLQQRIPAGAIKSNSNPGTSTITGDAKGRYAERAILYSVSLYGPNDFSIRRAVAKFNSGGRFVFSALPEGRYRIVISPDPGKADVGTELKPPPQSGSIIDCKRGETQYIDIVFKQ